jgi:hypothetical protein
MNAPLLVVPGINDSPPDHWQSMWQNSRSDSVRLEPSDWTRPLLADWLAALERAIAECSAPPIIVAHSLGCILTVRWAEQTATTHLIRGAFLVAPPDPQSAHFPVEAPTFRIVPRRPLGFACVVIASTDDPYSKIESAKKFAYTIDAGFVSIGACGHINSESNIGAWTQGRDLLECFAAGLSVRI